jgi:transcriptional regulator with XRE-family HTH domain
MRTFPELLKKIREEGGLTQKELARALGVSTILISMVETGQKEVSKNLVIKLAAALGVHPSSIIPFVFIDKGEKLPNPSGMEKSFIGWGEKLQNYLIKVKSKKLKRYV